MTIPFIIMQLIYIVETEEESEEEGEEGKGEEVGEEKEEESEDASLKKLTSSSLFYYFPTTINMYALLLLMYDLTVSSLRLNFC